MSSRVRTIDSGECMALEWFGLAELSVPFLYSTFFCVVNTNTHTHTHPHIHTDTRRTKKEAFLWCNAPPWNAMKLLYANAFSAQEPILFRKTLWDSVPTCILRKVHMHDDSRRKGTFTAGFSVHCLLSQLFFDSSSKSICNTIYRTCPTPLDLQ